MLQHTYQSWNNQSWNVKNKKVVCNIWPATFASSQSKNK